MSVVALTEEDVAIDVTVTEGEAQAPEDVAGPLSRAIYPGLARHLRRLGAPVDLVHETAIAAAEDSSSGGLLDRIDEFLFERDEEPPDSVEQITLPLRVLAAAAPPGSESSVAATLSLEAEGQGGLDISLGVFGTKGTVKYTVSSALSVTCNAGQAKIGSLLIPALLETRLRRRSPGGERFPLTRVRPLADVSQIGGRADSVNVVELLAGELNEPVHIGGGDAPFTSSASRKLDLEWSLELGPSLTDSLTLKISAAVSGGIEIKTEYTVPAGSFSLYWLNRPAGLCITPAR